MLPKDLIYHFVPVATDRCCPLSLTGYLSKHLIVFIKKILKDKNIKLRSMFFWLIFFSLKRCAASLSFLSLLLTVTSLERSLRSLGTSNDTQELQDGL